MKLISRITATAVFVFCYYFSHSQPALDDRDSLQRIKYQKNLMNTTPYVFEGKVIEIKYLKESGFTCSIIQIAKIFKGKGWIKLGTIKVITMQGDGNGEVVIDGGPYLMAGETYLIFGNSNPKLLPSLDLSDKADNDLTVRAGDVIVYDFKNQAKHPKNTEMFPVANWLGTKFKSLDELYAYLKNNGGLTVQEEAEK